MKQIITTEQKPIKLWCDNIEEGALQQELNKSRFQLGALGGGNHFIEIQHGSDGYIWLWQ